MKRLTAAELLLVISLLLFSACGGSRLSGGGSIEEAVQAGVAATLTKEAWLEGVEAARQTSIAGEAAQTQGTTAPELATPPATGTPQPAGDTSTPEGPAAAQPVEHRMTPGVQMERINTFVTDFNSIDYGEEGYTYGDVYYLNRFERPFTAQSMEYRGYLDITLVNWKVNSPWIFGIVYLAEELPESGGVRYALEIDLDENGRGDYLILTDLPTSQEWSTNGVRVLTDQDQDVGGDTPLFANDPDPELNGYETVIFDRGSGEDPDLAWVRRNPADPRSVEIAFKESLVGPGGYMWSAWADEGIQNPGWFDYNDRIPFTNAGSPNPDHPYYPIKEIELVDSTCRSWYGFQPTGNEPGLCAASTGTEKIEGFCPRYESGVQPDCSQVCLTYCPSDADFCIPCRR